MKYKVEILPAAWEDLKHIEAYYILTFGEKTAAKVVNSILDRLEQLEMFPDIGSQTPDKWLNDRGYKMLICKKRHIAIYKHIDDFIYIYHIADTKMEYTKLFK